jgi:hypothetical protein
MYSSENYFKEVFMPLEAKKLILAVQKRNPILIESMIKPEAEQAIKLATQKNNIHGNLLTILTSQINNSRIVLESEFVENGHSIATQVASYLVDNTLTIDHKNRWALILLDMLIIGCNYQLNNFGNSKSIATYLSEANLPKWDNIVSKMTQKPTLSIEEDLLPLRPSKIRFGENTIEQKVEFLLATASALTISSSNSPGSPAKQPTLSASTDSSTTKLETDTENHAGGGEEQPLITAKDQNKEDVNQSCCGCNML